MENISEKGEQQYTMSTTSKDSRPKRPIVKPSRYQTTSSDEAPLRKTSKTGGQEMNTATTMEDDIRELRGILPKNSCTINDTHVNTLHNTLTSTQYNNTNTQILCNKPQTPTQTSTQVHQVEQLIDNQYHLPSASTINAEPHPISYSHIHNTPYAQHRPTTFIPNEYNAFDNINATISNKFQIPYSNIGESTAGYRVQAEQDNTENRKTQERLDRIEQELRTLNTTMKDIYRCVRTKENRRRALQKPKCLPISTEIEMQTFETIDEEIYEEVVEYLRYIGGFTVKEAVNLSFKEVIKDGLMVAYTWFGSKQGLQPLYKTCIIMTIYGMTLIYSIFFKHSLI